MNNLKELNTKELTGIEGGSWYPWDWAAFILSVDSASQPYWMEPQMA